MWMVDAKEVCNHQKKVPGNLVLLRHFNKLYKEDNNKQVYITNLENPPQCAKYKGKKNQCMESVCCQSCDINQQNKCRI